jgi:hypothetical protein
MKDWLEGLKEAGFISDYEITGENECWFIPSYQLREIKLQITEQEKCPCNIFNAECFLEDDLLCFPEGEFPPGEIIGDCTPQCTNCIREGKEGWPCTCGNPAWSAYYMGIQKLKEQLA